MANKRKCANCKQIVSEYIVIGLQAFCNIDSAVQYSYANKAKGAKVIAKEGRKKHRAAKEKLKSRSAWLKEAQVSFNKFIRMRDHDQPCISCQRFHTGKYDAGHYRSAGGNPELRFNELNCHAQCVPCNQHLSGNLIDYRINLINKIGQGEVDKLEGPHDAKKYTIDQIKEIKAEYAAKAKDLE